jgi:hypothetical protein
VLESKDVFRDTTQGSIPAMKNWSPERKRVVILIGALALLVMTMQVVVVGQRLAAL